MTRLQSTIKNSRLFIGLAKITILLAIVVFAAAGAAVHAEDAPPANSAATIAPEPPAASPTDPAQNSVVKVFATARYPDPFRPWTKQAPQDITGSGVVIGGKRILTNAHVVLYASQVQVQANQASDKISATVEAIAPGIDLALLKLDDETFFKTHPPLERTNVLPQITDAVMAYGYPAGGNSLSITKGIVSRIEFTNYKYAVAGLRIQIDAAINPGNSGGPAVAGGKMIGIAFSQLGGAQNIGYIIPCEEIDLFLKDIADGKYDGKPALLDEFQTLENPALRAFLKLDKSIEGTIVHQPYKEKGPSVLKEWDVITRIGDTPVDNLGMVKINSNLRVRFLYLLQKVAKDGKVRLQVLRAGQLMPIDVPVAYVRPMLIPSLQGAYPSYFIYGPLVLSKATAELVSAINAGKNNFFTLLCAIGNPIATRLGESPAFPGEELVVIASPFLPHKLAKGYNNAPLGVVKSINGIAVKNLRHAIEILRDSRMEFIKVDLAHRGSETMVFPRKDMLAATEEILNDNGIRSQGSPDTMTVWNAARPRK